MSDAIPGVDGDIIWVTEFKEESAEAFVTAVLKATRESETAPIVVYINSSGGSADALAAMVSVMDSVPNTFVTACTGAAMSAGAMLLAHGDVRCVGPHSRVMIHAMSGGAGGNIEDFKADAKEMARMDRAFVKLLAKDCGKTIKELRALWLKRRDYYMTAVEAVEFGIADHVGVPLIKSIEGFEVKIGTQKKSKR
jgi:ATP-dependent Clp protease protease subunit